MSNIKIDLTNYKPQFGDRVDAGRYLATVTSVEQTKARSTGNDMIVVWLEIAAGPFEGKALRTNLTLTEKAMFKVVEFLSALGYKTPKKALTVNTDQWLRKQVVIDVENRENEYNGTVTTRTEVSSVMRATPDLVRTMRASGNLTEASEPAADVADVEDVEAEVPATEPKASPTPAASPAPETAEDGDEGIETVDENEDIDLDALTEL